MIILQHVYYLSSHLNEVYQNGVSQWRKKTCISEILSGPYRTNISELNSAESMKKFKGMLKSTFNSYYNVIYDLLDDCRRNAAISEAVDYISELVVLYMF